MNMHIKGKYVPSGSYKIWFWENTIRNYEYVVISKAYYLCFFSDSTSYLQSKITYYKADKMFHILVKLL
jgi:hypothetical protein